MFLTDPVLGDSVPASQLVSQRSNIERPVPDPRPRPTPKKAVSAPASDMMTFDPDLQLPSGGRLCTLHLLVYVYVYVTGHCKYVTPCLSHREILSQQLLL